MTARSLTLALAISVLGSCTEEKIRTYRVASEEPNDTTRFTSTPAAVETIGKLHWKPLDGWEEQTPGQFQTALYKISDEASLSVSSLSGDGGGIPANVNRWRAQIGLQPAADVGGDLIEVVNENISAYWFELKGEKQSIFAAIISMPTETWFFKLTTATSELDTMRDEFKKFLLNVDMQSKPNTTPQAPETPTPPTENKSGIGLDVPEGWVKSEGSSMRVASFSIKGEGVPDADVSVVPLMGESGSVLDNVNRWRGQVKLSALESEQDPAIGKEVKGTAGTFLITHMISEEPLFENDKKGAISTAILRREDVTWFFKITGESELVLANREKFEAFVLTADIP